MSLQAFPVFLTIGNAQVSPAICSQITTAGGATGSTPQQ